MRTVRQLPGLTQSLATQSTLLESDPLNDQNAARDERHISQPNIDWERELLSNVLVHMNQYSRLSGDQAQIKYTYYIPGERRQIISCQKHKKKLPSFPRNNTP